MNRPRREQELNEAGEQAIAKGTRCLDCGEPFKFGNKGDPGVNVYTPAGRRETVISLMCEKCFDAIFEE